MLYATISPSAKKVNPITPFETSVIECNEMCAMARPYVLGAAVTNFEVQFGNLIKDKDGGILGFDRKDSINVEMTSDELAGWGEDDSIVLKAIAEKIKTKVINTIDFEQRLALPGNGIVNA